MITDNEMAQSMPLLIKFLDEYTDMKSQLYEYRLKEATEEIRKQFEKNQKKP